MTLFWSVTGTPDCLETEIVFMDLYIKGHNTNVFPISISHNDGKLNDDHPSTAQRIAMKELGKKLHDLQTFFMKQSLDDFKDNSIFKPATAQTSYNAFSLSADRAPGHQKHRIHAMISDPPSGGRSRCASVTAYRCTMTAGFTLKAMLETICMKLQDAISACELFQVDVGRQIEGRQEIAPDPRLDAHSMEIAKLQKTVISVEALQRRVTKMEPLIAALEGFRGLLGAKIK